MKHKLSIFALLILIFAFNTYPTSAQINSPDGSNRWKKSDQSFRWIGKDDRGIELEVIAVATPQYLLVIHVMPYQYRRK
jgi:hypothetical protein